MSLTSAYPSHLLCEASWHFKAIFCFKVSPCSLTEQIVSHLLPPEQSKIVTQLSMNAQYRRQAVQSTTVKYDDNLCTKENKGLSELVVEMYLCPQQGQQRGLE